MSRLPKFISCAFALVLLAWWAPPGSASAENADTGSGQQRAGLMWNHTGLPAVFPLQVKSSMGRDYFLTLVDTETGEDAFAAYIEGGSYFRVLVPPGDFRLRFAAGMIWQGEEHLFGSGALTQVFELESPLTFEVRNPGIKAGHIVDLSRIALDQMAHADTKEQFICQTLRWEYLRLPNGHEISLGRVSPEDHRLIWPWHGQPLFPVRRPADALRHTIRLKLHYLERYRIVRSRICG